LDELIMKSIFFTACTAVAAAASAFVGMPSLAHAGVLTTPGSACKVFGSSPSAAGLSAIGSTQAGTTNGDLQLSRSVICPVVRQGDQDGVTVYVDGQASEAAPVSCILYSYNYDGTLKASKGFVEKRAQFDRSVSLSAAEAPLYAYLNVVCSLPGLHRAKIFGVLTSD